jgi:hypothetical protein
MSQKIQSLKEQHMNSVQYTISKDRPTNEAPGDLKWGLALKPWGTIRIEFTQIGWFLW